jgi:hypothetical protein
MSDCASFRTKESTTRIVEMIDKITLGGKSYNLRWTNSHKDYRYTVVCLFESDSEIIGFGDTQEEAIEDLRLRFKFEKVWFRN